MASSGPVFQWKECGWIPTLLLLLHQRQVCALRMVLTLFFCVLWFVSIFGQLILIFFPFLILFSKSVSFSLFLRKSSLLVVFCFLFLFWTYLRKMKTRDSMGGQSIIAFIKTLKMKTDAYIGEYGLCLVCNLHLNLSTIFHKTASRNTPRVTVPRGRYQHEECAHLFTYRSKRKTCMHVWLSLWVASRSEAAIVLTVTSLGQFCFTSTEVRLLIRDWGGGGREWRLNYGYRPKKTREIVDRCQKNGGVKAVSPHHCAVTSALRSCCFNCHAGHSGIIQSFRGQLLV